jgi:hypothetical protein
MRTWRRFRRTWRRWSTAQRLGFAAVLVLGPLLLASAAKTTTREPTPAVAASASGNVALGQQIAAGYGWSSGQQWQCLDALWQRESGWSATAGNPQSGAYGIPQALPPGKMPAAALPPESSAAVQVTWGLGYIASRYTNPCGAWAHETADGWY